MPDTSDRRVLVTVDGERCFGRLDDADVVLDDGRRIPEADAIYLAPVAPSKILAVHLSYRSRIEEYGARIPSAPSYFTKPPSSLNGHRGLIPRPAGGRFLNYEGELAVIIGRRMKGVPVEDALSYVAAYACANDVGLHDFRHADRGSMLRVKGQDGFLPLGPELVPAGEFDPTSFTLRTLLNGEVAQETTADDLLFPVAYQLADLCRLITLEPGDVLLSGTPANSRPMEPGDVVEIEISGLGRLSNTVVEWDVDLSAAGEQLSVSADTIHVALAVPEDEAERMASPGMIVLRSIDHVCLRVDKLVEARVRWARELGLLDRGGGEDRALLACEDEPYSLELVEGEPGHDHTAFELARDCALEEAAQALDAAGVAFEETDGVLCLADPDACGIHLVPFRERQRWVAHARPSEDVRPGAPRRLGHVNCLSANLAAGTRFYTDVLGMRVSDRLGTEGVWFHISSDHHVMALIAKGTSHFHHLAFDVVDIGQMRDLLDRIARHGRWLGWGPARHGVGGNIASYVRIVEERCFVELYCDMEQLQPDHEPRDWPDDRFSSNTWGPLPPRSYFRFDPVAVEWERESRELLGHPLPPEESP